MGTAVLLAAALAPHKSARESASSEVGLAASVVAAAADSRTSRERDLGEGREGLWTMRLCRVVSPEALRRCYVRAARSKCGPVCMPVRTFKP